MSIEVGIWRIGEKLQRLTPSSLALEETLEKHILADPSIISPGLLVLGHQVPTSFGGRIDILAIDPAGKLVVIEIKRERTPRDVVAQALDYASWVQGLAYDDIRKIYEERHGGRKFEVAFAEAFGEGPPETINEAHELIVVASRLDPSTERIIDYLSDRVPINAVFFQCFRDGEREYLARTWLIDPDEAEAKNDRKARRGAEPWNGRDFYVSLGEGEHQNWEDCREYGFVSGGGGRWYVQTLAMLEVGSRVFVNIPKEGYVGVGMVTAPVLPAASFVAQVNGIDMPLLSAPRRAPNMGKNAEDPELREHVVGVRWIKTVSRSEAYWEKGLFASQHTACRLRNQFTIDCVSRHFGIDD